MNTNQVQRQLDETRRTWQQHVSKPRKLWRTSTVAGLEKKIAHLQAQLKSKGAAIESSSAPTLQETD